MKKKRTFLAWLLVVTCVLSMCTTEVTAAAIETVPESQIEMVETEAPAEEIAGAFFDDRTHIESQTDETIQETAESQIADSDTAAESQTTDSDTPAESQVADSDTPVAVAISETSETPDELEGQSVEVTETFDGLGDVNDVQDMSRLRMILPDAAATDLYYDQLDAVSQEVYNRMYDYYKDVYTADALQLALDFSSITMQEVVWNKNTETGEWVMQTTDKETLSANVGGTVSSAFLALLYDHPEMSWITGVSWNLSYSYNISNVVVDGASKKGTIAVSWIKMSLGERTYDVGTSAEIQSALSQAKKVLESDQYGINDAMSDYSKIRCIHDYICNTIAYADDQNALVYQTAYSAFYDCDADGKIETVCAGYAKSFKLLCNAYGIKCILVSGTGKTSVSSGAHMWNYVQMADGNWYAVDCTWDDQTEKLTARIAYDFFMVGSETAASLSFGGRTFGSSHINSGSWASSGRYIFSYPMLNSIHACSKRDEGHIVVGDAIQPATLTADGMTSGTYCSVCSDTITVPETIPSIDHAVLSASRFAYTGEAIVPEVTVYDRTDNIIDATFYDVNYLKNVAIGTAEAKITFKEQYAGEITLTYEIMNQCEFNGVAHTPVIDAMQPATVTADGLTAGSHCRVCQEMLTTGDVIPSIGRVSLSQTKLTYTGKGIKPTVTVYDRTGSRISSAYYDVSYANNTAIGTGSAKVTFKGNYGGEKAFTFTIVKAANALSVGNIAKTYQTKTQSFYVNVKRLENARLTYQSNNKNIKIDSKGKVTIASKYVGKAIITMKSAETDHYLSATKQITITVNPTGTKLSSFTDSKDGKAVVKWSKNTVGSGYQIQYAAQSNFSKVIKTVTISKNKTTQTTLSGLNHAVRYYVRVRTYKTVSGVKYYSGWSSSKSITVSLTPAKVKLSSVKKSGSGKLKVKWQKNSKASGYQVQYSTDSQFKTAVKTVSVTSYKTTSKTISGLKKGSRYYVRVRTYKKVNGKYYYAGWSSVKNVKV